MAENRWNGFSDKELGTLFAGGDDDKKLRNELAAEILRRKETKPALVIITRSNGFMEEIDVRISRTISAAGEAITLETPITLRSGESLTILPGKEAT